MPEQFSSSAKTEDATNDMVAQVAARVIAAMREEAGAASGATPPPPSPPTPAEVVDQARQAAGGVVGAVQQQAVSRLDKQKEHAAEELASVAGTVRQMGDQLKQPEHGAVAQYAAHYGDVAADQLQHLSGYLREHDVKQLVREVESFARREPLLFTGGAFVLGLIGARFLKSKPPVEETVAPPSDIASAAPAADTTSSEQTISTPEATVPIPGAPADESGLPFFVAAGDDGADKDLPYEDQFIDDALVSDAVASEDSFASPTTSGS